MKGTEKHVVKNIESIASKQNENLNKSFKDILLELVDRYSSKDYLLDKVKITKRGTSNTKGKEGCNVYFIIGINNDVEYKIRTCPDYPNDVEIKKVHGHWKTGPFDKGLKEFLESFEFNNTLKIIKEYLSAPDGKIIGKGKSYTNGKKECTVYFIGKTVGEYKYKIRTCPNSSHTIEIHDGVWKTGPLDNEFDDLIKEKINEDEESLRK